MLRHIPRLGATLVGLALAGSAARAQVPTYDLTFLGNVPGAPTSTKPTAVNDHGLVVGTATASGSSKPFAASVLQAPVVLPLLPGDVSGEALAVNNAGVIAGTSGAAGTGVLWTPSPTGYTVAALPPAPGGLVPARATALNELGDVVGWLSNGHAFAWSASSGTVDLAVQGVVGGPLAINESRQVVAGHQRIDLDTLIVETATIPAISWNFTHVNDAGVAVWHATVVDPVFGSLSYGGTYEFGVGPTYWASGLHGFLGGIDYAGTFPFVSDFTDSGDQLHFELFGKKSLQSVIDPADSGWITGLLSGAGVSANGLITVFAASTTTNKMGPVLLTPQRFHAILDGAPGAQGLPVLTGEGTLQGGSLMQLHLSHAAPAAPAALIAGLAPANLPFYGGMLVPTPTLVFTGLSTDANGKLTLATTWPNGLPSGTNIYVQEWIADASAPFGIAGSNALECVVP